MCIACNAGMKAILRYNGSRREFLKHVGMFSASVFTGSLAGTSKAVAQSTGRVGAEDIVFRGGPILTMNSDQPGAQAIAIRGNRILAVGSCESVAAQADAGARVIDLQGRTLMPGLIDPHMHNTFVLFEDWIDVSPIVAPRFEDVQRKIRESAGNATDSAWIRAQQFDPSITQGARIPDLSMLDQWVPNRPFFMIESNGHVAYVNSYALKLAGITRHTPDPPLARFVRDANGNLTGRLEESNAMMPFIEKMPVLSAFETQARIKRLLSHAASVGCTTLHDCGIGMQAGIAELDLLDAIMADDPPVRYRGMLVSTLMDDWEKSGIKPGRGNDQFRIDGIKAWSDGSNQAYTGYQRENYLGKNSRGSLNYTLAQLTEVIRRAHAGGWQIGVHANGDAGIDTTLQAYEAVLTSAPYADHRHRIEHCSILHPEQIEKMHTLGLSPSFLIGHIRWWGKAFRDRILGPDRARFYDPCASALAGKLRISLHSDWNVTPIEPLRYIEDAVARVMNEGGGVFYGQERISIQAALRAVTIDAAWQCRMDDLVGSLEEGKYADFTITEENPMQAEPTQISKIKVSETWMAGRQRYQA